MNHFLPRSELTFRGNMSVSPKSLVRWPTLAVDLSACGENLLLTVGDVTLRLEFTTAEDIVVALSEALCISYDDRAGPRHAPPRIDETATPKRTNSPTRRPS
jgi:hypothetical protein